jgi:hypothetical protein
MIGRRFTQWLWAPVVTGRLAILLGAVAVAIPTVVRAAVHGTVTGCEFTPYLPFVLLAAILLGWRHATVVALASVAILGGLFAGPPNEFLKEPCTVSAAGIFLGSSAMIIASVAAVRRMIVELQIRRSGAPNGGIIFSLDKDKVWASWNGSGPPLLLGSQDRVETMMEDFLAQSELGRRLTGQSD